MSRIGAALKLGDDRAAWSRIRDNGLARTVMQSVLVFGLGGAVLFGALSLAAHDPRTRHLEWWLRVFIVCPIAGVPFGVIMWGVARYSSRPTLAALLIAALIGAAYIVRHHYLNF
jgi:hypothetical protein